MINVPKSLCGDGHHKVLLVISAMRNTVESESGSGSKAVKLSWTGDRVEVFGSLQQLVFLIWVPNAITLPAI